MRRSFLKLNHLSAVLAFLAIIVIALPILREIRFKDHGVELLDFQEFGFFLEYHQKNQKNSIHIADQALKNIYQISYEHLEFSVINKAPDDLWQDSTIYDSNSHEFYAHSLSMLWHFLIAHQQTRNFEYLTKGRELIISWIKNNRRFNPNLSYYAWGDHSTAKRAIVTLFFLDYYQNYKLIDDEFSQLAIKHINDALQYLSNPSNYNFPHNHGIYQDIALYFIASHLESQYQKEKYQNLAVKRFQKQIENSFSENGFHLENSPGYHFLTLQKISEFLSLIKDKSILKNDVNHLIESAEKNKELLIFGRNYVSPIGDTEMLKIHDTSLPGNSLFAADSLAGFLHYRSPSHTLHVRSTGISNTHSHNDAFSFIYSDEERIIITETGFLDFSQSYNSKFTQSLQAHNTFLPEMLLDDFNINHHSKISAYANSENILYCKIESQNIASVSRIFLLDKLFDCLFIIDTIDCDKYQKWLRIFQLSNEAEIIEKGADRMHIKVNETSYFFQSLSQPMLLLNGSENPKLGWNAESKELVKAKNIVQYTSDDVNLISLSKSDPITLIEFYSEGLLFKKADQLRKVHFFPDYIQMNNDSLSIEKYQVKPNEIRQKKNILSFRRRLQLLISFLILMIFTFFCTRLLKRKKIFPIINQVLNIFLVIISLVVLQYLLSNFQK